MLSRFVISFLPRSKCHLISPSAVILEPKEIKLVNASTVSSSICHEAMGPDAVSFKPTKTSSSDFFKSSLYICKFSVHVPLKPSLKDFEYNLTSMWNEHNCTVVCTFLSLPFFGIGMKTDLFQSYVHCCGFQICWHTKGSTLTASSFRILNSSAGIPSPSITLFVE